MKRILLVTALLCCSSVNAEVPDVLFDKEYKRQALERRAFINEACESVFNMSMKMDCFQDKAEEFQSKGTVRGYDAWMDKHYSSLSLSEAENKLIELKKLFALAGKHKRFSMNTKPEKGELNVDLLKAEIWYLKQVVREKEAPKPGMAEDAEALGAHQMADRIRKLTAPTDQ